MAIKGAFRYTKQFNSHRPGSYNCQFPEKDFYRQKIHKTAPIIMILAIIILFTTTTSVSAFMLRPTTRNSRIYIQEHTTISLFGKTEAAAGETPETPFTTTSTTTTSTTQHASTASASRYTARVRKRVAELARKRLAGAPWIRNIAPMPRAVASVLKDATLNAVDLAVDEGRWLKAAALTHFVRSVFIVLAYRNKYSSRTLSSSTTPPISSGEYDVESATAMIEEAFAPLEALLTEKKTTQLASDEVLDLVAETKSQCLSTVAAMEAASMAQAHGTAEAVAAVQFKQEQVLADLPIDFSDMAPPFLDEQSCLVPGEPIVRVEKAPENSRRIFAGIDIPVAVDKVWELLTDYENLQRAVPNLVVNNVLELYDAEKQVEQFDTCNGASVQDIQEHSVRLKGALLRQVGGAKIAGLQFSARTTLEVREWPHGLPPTENASEESKLERYKFPRPFALSSLPTKDITMQSIEDDDGEFRMYQGVWRMQPLPGCAPPGEEAMRLTYAVEISPRAYLPVQLIERRIVRDLCRNLEAIRDYVTSPTS